MEDAKLLSESAIPETEYVVRIYREQRYGYPFMIVMDSSGKVVSSSMPSN
jgi:hypothetical protein